MKRLSVGPLLPLLITGALAACDRNPTFGPDIEAVGVLSVDAYYEYDLTAGASGGDAPAAGLEFEVLLFGSETPIATGVADAEGRIQFDAIPVGTYDVRVSPAFLGDSLTVARIDTTRVTVTTLAEATLGVGVSPPDVPVADLADLPAGRRVWVTGLALNSRASSVEGAIHVLEEGAGAVRVVFTATAFATPGDSVRVLGTVTGSGAERRLVGGRLLTLAQSVRPVLPVEVSIDEARTAADGDRASRLVVIRTGEVTDTATIDFVARSLTVSDGDAEVTVLLPTQNGFGAPVAVGSIVVSVVGLLVPDPSGSDLWQIVPRGPSDVQITPPPPPEEGS